MLATDVSSELFSLQCFFARFGLRVGPTFCQFVSVALGIRGHSVPIVKLEAATRRVKVQCAAVRSLDSMVHSAGWVMLLCPSGVQ